MLENISISQIYPHPDNPRQDLGDLAELAESIKTKGILQNLTIVPKDEDQYTVVIGHRRLAAAKKAGLDSVPCIVTKMSDTEQVATMLLENMQRTDLTIYEQAKGMQMMLDMGETVAGISDKTGFSSSTVRRRVSLIDLDQKTFKDSVKRGATLADFAELDKISDITLKNEVLENIGTNNFGYSLRTAIAEEKWLKAREEIINKLSKFATPVEDTKGYRSVAWYGTHNQDIVTPDDIDSVDYFYKDDGNNYITLFREKTGDDEEPERDLQREKQQETNKLLNEIAERAYQLRYDFIKNFTAFKKNSAGIMEFSIAAHLAGNWIDIETLKDLFGVESSDNEDKMSYIDYVLASSLKLEQKLLYTAYAHFEDSKSNDYFGWQNEHQENKKMDSLYSCLEKLGYQMSDEEKEMQSGTHELFKEAL